MRTVTTASADERFADTLRPEVERRIAAHHARNPQDKHGVHVYSLEQFGLNADTERRRFARYCARFQVEEESPERWRH